MAFDYSLDFEKIDFREKPELYRVGRGEQGVLLVEPYKGEILHIGDSRPLKLQGNLRKKFMRCLMNTRKRMILLAWTWPGSFFRWATQGPGAIRIIKAAGNTIKTGM